MTTMTSKGQVTIPKRLRDALGLKPGSRVEFEMDPSGRVVVKRAGKLKKTGIEQFRGSLKGGLSTDEILRLTRG
jgi:AbrB family looped-hinge helix DNA binding protein